MGVSQDSVSGYENGRVRPPDEFLAKLAKQYKIQFEDLVKMRALEFALQAYETEGKHAHLTPVKIPIYRNEASAGNGCFNDRDTIANYLTVDEDMRPDLPGRPENLVVLKVRGDSMVPTIHPDELVIIDKSEIRQGRQVRRRRESGDIKKPLREGQWRSRKGQKFVRSTGRFRRLMTVIVAKAL